MKWKKAVPGTAVFRGSLDLFYLLVTGILEVTGIVVAVRI